MTQEAAKGKGTGGGMKQAGIQGGSGWSTRRLPALALAGQREGALSPVPVLTWSGVVAHGWAFKVQL